MSLLTQLAQETMPLSVSLSSVSYNKPVLMISVCNGFAQVRNENLAPGSLHAQLKTPSQYKFTILSLIVPSYSYSCGLRALIEAMRSSEIITLRNPLNIRFLYN